MVINLLSIMEAGGYPDFITAYQSLNCEFLQLKSLRKAIRHIKKNPVDIIVTEYNFQTQFRDRTSSLESLMAILQFQQNVKVIVLIEKAHQEHFIKVSSRFPIFATINFPIEEKVLMDTVAEAISQIS
ncbi:MAG: hypothetical protein QM479_12375 [Pseudomonadota bacterium]